MDDLTAFLKARLDEDEATARAASPGPWEDGGGYVTDAGAHVQVTDYGSQDEDSSGSGPQGEADSAHIARHDPARVLRAVEAKRNMLNTIAALALMSESFAACLSYEMAAEWADHADYLPEWKPDA